MFTKLFLETTNPKTSWIAFMKLIPIICLSILVNITIYTIFLNLASYVFVNKFFSKNINMRFVGVLIIIMILGYIGRFLHAKEAYKMFQYKESKTAEYMNTHYNSWVFLG